MMNDDKCMRILSIQVSSLFQDFESFLRTEVDLVEDDIRLVLDEYNFSFYDIRTKTRFLQFQTSFQSSF